MRPGAVAAVRIRPRSALVLTASGLVAKIMAPQEWLTVGDVERALGAAS